MRPTLALLATAACLSLAACVGPIPDSSDPPAAGADAERSAVPGLPVVPDSSATDELADDPADPIDETRQPLTPLGLACWLATATVSIAGTASCSQHPEDPSCSWGKTGGMIALSTLCWFL